MAAPATEPTYDITMPEPPTADDRTESAPYRYIIDVTQQDPELRAIEASLVILQMLPYDTRVRVLTYLRDRIDSDPMKREIP